MYTNIYVYYITVSTCSYDYRCYYIITTGTVLLLLPHSVFLILGPRLKGQRMLFSGQMAGAQEDEQKSVMPLNSLPHGIAILIITMIIFIIIIITILTKHRSWCFQANHWAVFCRLSSQPPRKAGTLIVLVLQLGQPKPRKFQDLSKVSHLSIDIF